MWEISPRVNSPKNDDSSLWEPVDAEPTQTIADMLELVGNGIMREHAPVNGNELFDEFLREALVFAMLRSRRNRLGDSGWFFHGGISFPLLKRHNCVPKRSKSLSGVDRVAARWLAAFQLLLAFFQKSRLR